MADRRGSKDQGPNGTKLSKGVNDVATEVRLDEAKVRKALKDSSKNKLLGH